MFSLGCSILAILTTFTSVTFGYIDILYCYGFIYVIGFFAAAASEPEANEWGSFLIIRRLHYRGLQSLFLTKRKELWLCANGRLGCAVVCARNCGCARTETYKDAQYVIWRKELWLCANGWFRMRSEPCVFLSRLSLFAYILQILTRVSKRFY